MKREYMAGAGESAPSVPASPSAGYPSPGDITTNVDGTVLGAYWFHMVTEALITIIEEAGLTPDNEPTQFRDAMRALFAEKLAAKTSLAQQPGIAGGVTDITLRLSYGGTEVTRALGIPIADTDENLQWGDYLELELPAAWMEGDTVAYLGRFRVSGTRNPSTRSGEIALAIGSHRTSTAVLARPNLKSAVRAGLRVELETSTGTSVVVTGIVPDDPNDPHVWQPSNFAEVVTFFNTVKALGDSNLLIPTTRWVQENNVDKIIIARNEIGSGTKVKNVWLWPEDEGTVLGVGKPVDGALKLRFTVEYAADLTG